MNVEKKYWLFLLLFILVAVIVQLILFHYRTYFHVDEVFSFGMANGDRHVLYYHHPDEFDNHLFSGHEIETLFAPVEPHSFVRLWYNLSDDCHMPLYYVFLKSLSYFWVPYFSPISGIILNVIALSFLLLGVFLLAKMLLKNDMLALLSVFLFMFLQVVLSMECFFRMYLLWMMISVYFTIFVIKYLQSQKYSDLFYVFLLSLLSILTHFYGLIYGFFIGGLGVLFFLIKKKNKQLILYAIILLLSVLTAYLIFPAMLNIGMNDGRGVEFQDNFKNILLNPQKVFTEQLPYFWNNVCGGLGWLLLFSFLLMSGLFIAVKNKHIDKNELYIISFLFCLFIGFGLLTAIVQPYMAIYQVRYFSPIIPIGLVLFVYIFVLWGKILHLNHKAIVFCIWLIAAINGISSSLIADNPFYFRGFRETEKLNRIVEGGDIWWAMGGGWAHSYYIHNFADKVKKINHLWSLVDFDNEDFVAFSNSEVAEKKYAYLLFPPQQAQAKDWVSNWVEEKTGRHAYYLFTIQSLAQTAMAFEASVFLVTPY